MQVLVEAETEGEKRDHRRNAHTEKKQRPAPGGNLGKQYPQGEKCGKKKEYMYRVQDMKQGYRQFFTILRLSLNVYTILV